MQPGIKVAFASGTDDLNTRMIERMRAIMPELALWVVSDFAPEDRDLKWIPYHVNRSFRDNFARIRAVLRGNSIRLAGVMLVPNVPYRRMRLIALLLSPRGFLAFNENLDNFMLRPGSVPAIFGHVLWRFGNLVRWLRTALPAVDWGREASFGVAVLAGFVRFPGGAGSSKAKPLAPPRTPGCDGLERAFGHVPDLFCATVPNGPIPAGSNFNYVLRANSSHALYDEAKLRQLKESQGRYSSEGVTTLDLCFRAWQNGWPTVQVEAPAAADASLRFDRDYLRFLVRSVANPKVFRKLWRAALVNEPGSVLRSSARLALLQPRPLPGRFPEELFLALTGGDVAVFPGRAASTGNPRILVASPYLPYPLSHGGAVRIFNLMARAAGGFDQILIAFTDDLTAPPAEILNICIEVVLVRRAGTHALPSRGRPETVEEFDSDAFRGALRQTVQKYRPSVVQLEFTQMAQYAGDCTPAATVLVEHDITFDLYEQQARLNDDWELRRQLRLWRRFEIDAWSRVSRVVTMSTKDRDMVSAAAGADRAVVLPNGVDLDRFSPSPSDPEPRRLLFIGSFAHLPNLMALEFFVNNVMPMLADVTLHAIGGARHEYYLNFYRDRVSLNLDHPSLEVEGFVSDVRPAYNRATLVIAPLMASAGTNIKVLEAMAMGKAVISTPAGINGLDLSPDNDVVVVRSAEEMAEAIRSLFSDTGRRRKIETAARKTVAREYGWDPIASKAAALYREL